MTEFLLIITFIMAGFCVALLLAAKQLKKENIQLKKELAAASREAGHYRVLHNTSLEELKELRHTKDNLCLTVKHLEGDLDFQKQTVSKLKQQINKLTLTKEKSIAKAVTKVERRYLQHASQWLDHLLGKVD